MASAALVKGNNHHLGLSPLRVKCGFFVDGMVPGRQLMLALISIAASSARNISGADGAKQHAEAMVLARDDL